MKTTIAVPMLFSLLVAGALPAHAAHPMLEGFSGSFIRAFVAYCLLFAAANVVMFVLTRLGVIKQRDDADEGPRKG